MEVTIAAHDDAEVNPIINTATADGDDFDGNPLTQVQDTHMTTIFHAYITVCKLVDSDGDLSSEGDQESYTLGWNFDLYRNGDPYDSKTTEPDGCVTFLILEPGIYKVVEDTPSGWTPLTPTFYDSIEVENDGTYSFTFINFEWFEVTVYKYVDWTGDGYTECEDTPLPGWNFYMDSDAGHHIEFGDLDSDDVVLDGIASVVVKHPGVYTVREVVETGWTQTGTEFYVFEAASGVDRGAEDPDRYIFTNFEHFTITGYKYEYFEGFFDNFDELNFPPWLKSVGDDSWTLTPEGWLYCDGSTEWSRIFAGPTMDFDDYVLEFDVQLIRDSGWEVFFRSNGLEGEDFASYSLQYEAHCEGVLRLLKYEGFTVTELDTSEFPPDYNWHHIKVRVFEDNIRIHVDGVLAFDVTDTVGLPYLSGGIGLGIIDDARAYFDNVRVLPIFNTLEGWTINLYKDGSSEPYDTYVTDSDGFYILEVKDPGHYEIAEVLLPGWSAILPILHVPEDPGEVVAGYSVDGISGKHIGCKDFWNFEWFEVSGFKWRDVNGDGVRVSGDVGLNTWIMYLFKDSPSIDPTDEYDTTETYYDLINGDGYYKFTIKEPGTYYIRELLKEGWTMTSPDLEVGFETEGIISGEGHSLVALSGMQSTESYDFGNFEWFKIWGYKWHDWNGNEFRDEEDVGLSCWEIYLFDSNPSDDPEDAIASTYTDCDDGYYEFVIKEEGSYYIREALPSGWSMTYPLPEIGPGTNGISTQGYDFPVFDALLANPDNLDFGNFQWLTISGFKWEDLNGNGFWDDGEPAINDWEILLYKGSTIFDPIEIVDTGSVSGWDTGYYEFIIKEIGIYFIRELIAPGWTKTCPGDFEFDEESNPVISFEGYDFTVDELVTDPTLQEGNNFGNFKWFKIWGHKYEDWDGTQESTERPIDDWKIELWIYDDALGFILKDDTMTDENPELEDDHGYYEFIVMEPGEYQIREDLQVGWVETAPVSAYGPGSVLGYNLGIVISGVDLENKDFWNAGLRTYITDTSDCRNIVTDFRLVVTPYFKTGEELYKISATNPGGFYFNFIFHSWTEGEMEIHYDLADEFIEKGGQPIHAYIWTDRNSNGLVDWCDDELESIHKNKIKVIDYDNGIIIFEDIEPSHDILVTIHMSFNKKAHQGLEKDDIEENLLDRGYDFIAFVEDSWSSTTTLTETSEEVKKLKACAVYGIVLEEADDDVPVSGASFSLYKDETLLKSMTTGDDGIFYFDKLDEGTYTLGIELPLGLILQDEKYSGTVIYLSIQIKLQKGDFIFAYVFIRTDAADPGEDPYVTTSMEHINIPESSSSSSYPGNHRDPFRDPEDYDYGVVVEPVLEQKVASSNLEIPILLTWFASVFSLASIFTARKIRRKGASKLYQIAEWDIGFECTFQNSEKQLEWAFEKDGSNLEPGWEKRFAWIRDCSRQLSFNPFIDEEDDNSSK
ncbi:MAG: SpaA isopeptide-forming pilin-related protein [Candidatus Thorarchaeota archaeon]